MVDKDYTEELLRIEGNNSFGSLFSNWNTSTAGVPKEMDRFPGIVEKW